MTTGRPEGPTGAANASAVVVYGPALGRRPYSTTGTHLSRGL